MARTISFDPQEVLSTVAKLFRQNGYDGTSMRDVQKVTGLAPTSLYAAFGNKEQLFEQALLRYREQLAAMTTEALGNPKDGLPLVQRYFEMVIANTCPKNACLMGRALMDGTTDRAAMVVHQTFQSLEGMRVEAFAAAPEQGQIHTDKKPLVLAQFAMAVSFGLQMQARRGIDKEEFADLVCLTMRSITQAAEATV